VVRTIVIILVIVILLTLLFCLALYLTLPPDLDTYGFWCSVRCRGDEGCLRECMVDRPEWWR